MELLACGCRVRSAADPLVDGKGAQDKSGLLRVAQDEGGCLNEQRLASRPPIRDRDARHRVEGRIEAHGWLGRPPVERGYHKEGVLN